MVSPRSSPLVADPVAPCVLFLFSGFCPHFCCSATISSNIHVSVCIADCSGGIFGGAAAGSMVPGVPVGYPLLGGSPVGDAVGSAGSRWENSSSSSLSIRWTISSIDSSFIWICSLLEKRCWNSLSSSISIRCTISSMASFSTTLDVGAPPPPVVVSRWRALDVQRDGALHRRRRALPFHAALCGFGALARSWPLS